MAYATVDELAAALRVRVTVDNTATLQACLDAAAVEIDHEIDAPDAEWGADDWQFSTLTANADPGPGRVRLNDANENQATFMYLDPLAANGTDYYSTLVAVRDNDAVEVKELNSGRWHRYWITGDALDNVGWLTVPIAFADSSGPPPQELVDLETLTLTFVRPTKPYADPLANRVNVLRGVEWWKANDAAFGVIGFDQTGALQAPRDGFNRHAFTLTPLKRQWGIA